MMPWVHLHVTQNGTVAPCCQAPWEPEHGFGDINQQPFEEIWNGEPMKAFRAKLMKDQPDYRCRKCYAMEKDGVKSMRQTTNERYAHKLDWVNTTDETGYAPDAKPVYWDIRYSNLCNLRCRICGPWSSSKWFKEARQLGMATGEKALTQSIENFDSFLGQMKKYLPYVEELHFAGGEPLLMEEHYKILKMLDEEKNYDVILFYNTNLSTLYFEGHSLPELWKNFRNVRLFASLDGSHKRGEFQRKDQRWEDVVNNRKLLRDVCPDITFMISPTVNVYNIWHLPYFHKEWVELGLLDVKDIRVNVLEQPVEYNVQILPPSFKKEITEKYRRHLEWMRSAPTNNEQARAIMAQELENAIQFMNAKDLSEHIQDFVKLTERLDEMRDESTLEVFPELKRIWGEVGAKAGE